MPKITENNHYVVNFMKLLSKWIIAYDKQLNKEIDKRNWQDVNNASGEIIDSINEFKTLEKEKDMKFSKFWGEDVYNSFEKLEEEHNNEGITYVSIKRLNKRIFEVMDN